MYVVCMCVYVRVFAHVWTRVGQIQVCFYGGLNLMPGVFLHIYGGSVSQLTPPHRQGTAAFTSHVLRL